MILPGHLATAVLARRYLRVDLYAVLAATLAPDVIDKFLYYVLRVTPHSRIPMHSLLGWLGSTVIVALVGRAAGVRWRWGWAWLVGYGGHLLADSPLAGGDLPFLYPFDTYTHLSASKVPFSFLWGLQDWPWHMLIAETLLVAGAAYLEWRKHDRERRAGSVRAWWRGLAEEDQP